MTRPEPYRPERPFEYECMQCGERVSADRHPGHCGACGGDVQDLSVPRE